MPLKDQPSPLHEKAPGTGITYGTIVSLKLPKRPLIKGMLSKRLGMIGIVNIFDPDLCSLLERVNRIPGGKILRSQIPFFPLQIEHFPLIRAYNPFTKFLS